MCVIGYKRRGLRFPVHALQPLFDANKDGMGFSCNTGDNKFKVGKAAVYTWAESLDVLERECPEWGDPESRSVIHFRIGTSGGRGTNVCHPFPMTPDIRTVDEPDPRQWGDPTLPVLYHNGVIRGFNELHLRRYSDTQLLVASLAGRSPEVWREYLDKLSSNNRFLLHWPTGAVEFFGPWPEWQGLKVSNLNFSSRLAFPASLDYSGADLPASTKWTRRPKGKVKGDLVPFSKTGGRQAEFEELMKECGL